MTFLSAPIVTVQVSDMPAHPPDHPAKTEVAFGAAVSLTCALFTAG